MVSGPVSLCVVMGGLLRKPLNSCAALHVSLVSVSRAAAGSLMRHKKCSIVSWKPQNRFHPPWVITLPKIETPSHPHPPSLTSALRRERLRHGMGTRSHAGVAAAVLHAAVRAAAGRRRGRTAQEPPRGAPPRGPGSRRTAENYQARRSGHPLPARMQGPAAAEASRHRPVRETGARRKAGSPKRRRQQQRPPQPQKSSLARHPEAASPRHSAGPVPRAWPPQLRPRLRIRSPKLGATRACRIGRAEHG